jgi:uncharacterized protein (TIGR02265 family)
MTTVQSSSTSSISDEIYDLPRLDRPVVLEEHLKALPSGATCKGLFFHDVLDRLRKSAPNHALFAPGGLGSRRYLHFFDYSYADYMRVLHGTASAIFPGASVGEGLRRLGRSSFPALANTQIGKVLYGVLGGDTRRVLELGARGYQVSLNFGRVEVIGLASRHLRYQFRNLPAFLETYQVGVVEGAMLACGVEGRVRVKLANLGNGSFDIRW